MWCMNFMDLDNGRDKHCQSLNFSKIPHKCYVPCQQQFSCTVLVLKQDCIQPKADYCSETIYENKILWQINVKKKKFSNNNVRSQDNTASIMTRLHTRWSRVWITTDAKDFLFSKMSRLAQVPTQPPMERVLEFFPGGTAARAWKRPLTSNWG